MKRPVRIVDYNPEWPGQFEELCKVIEKQLKNMIVKIEHIGSTAIPDCASKPIIDLAIIIESREQLPCVISSLEKLGYRHQGDKGVLEREAFARESDEVPVDGSGVKKPEHHLYVCAQDNTELQKTLSFREYLRNHPQMVKEYSNLKKHLAAKFQSDREGYTNAKTDFIQNILAKASPGS